MGDLAGATLATQAPQERNAAATTPRVPREREPVKRPPAPERPGDILRRLADRSWRLA